jgi:putative ABC transport system substrate-binding protein
MDRRSFLIGGLATLGAARAASAQRVHRIAVLVHGPERTQRGRVEALRAGLKQHGYVEGRNLSLSVHWNDGGLERLPSFAAELLKGKPDVVVAAPVLAAAAVQKHSASRRASRARGSTSPGSRGRPRTLPASTSSC